MPQFIQMHCEHVEKYVKQLVAHIDGLQRAGHFAHWELPFKESAGFLGRYHDLGKAGIADDFWTSEKIFTDDEWKLARAHTIIGAHLVKDKLSVADLTDNSDLQNLMVECCMYHHERWDGKGYPFGLKEEQIPLYARIVAVADAYDAMIEDRPYKKKIKPEQALQEIRREAGKQFDPDLAEIFCTVLEK